MDSFSHCTTAILCWQELEHCHKTSALEALKSGYSSPQRVYHGWEHIEDLLRKLEVFHSLASRLDLIKSTVFWHDAVYQFHHDDGTLRPDSENVADSARLFLQYSEHTSVERDAIEDMIMATAEHMGELHSSPEYYPGYSKDRDLLLDLDLSGLGASWNHFCRMEEKIRREFAWVAEEDFRKGRGDILKKLLAKPSLYRRGETYALWEQSARSNLARRMAELGS